MAPALGMLPSVPVGRGVIEEINSVGEGRKVLYWPWAPSSILLQSSTALGVQPAAPPVALSTETPDLLAIAESNLGAFLPVMLQ